MDVKHLLHFGAMRFSKHDSQYFLPPSSTNPTSSRRRLQAVLAQVK
jgi:hypothetical protein